MKFVRKYADLTRTHKLVKRMTSYAYGGPPVEIEVPDTWSQTAINILAQKYLRKAGVPMATVRVPEYDVPSWLHRSVPAEGTTFGGETSALQAFRRLAGCWTYHGWKGGYFSDADSAFAFMFDTIEMLASQMAAPASPQWFNCFSGRTEMITKEYGPVALSEVVGEEVSAWTRAGWKPATVKAFGRQPLQRVTFAPVYMGGGDYRPAWYVGKTNVRATLEVTPDHRWILKDGRETTELKVGDVVPACPVGGDLQHTPRYRDGFRHGVIFGDGSLAYRHKTTSLVRYRVRLCGHKKELAWAFDNVATPPCFGGDPLASVNSSSDLKDFPIYEAGEEYIHGFIDGWIATDGSVRESGAVRLSSNRADARAWLDRNAAYAGRLLVGHSYEDPKEVTFGDKTYKQSQPQHSFVLAQGGRAWKVTAVEPLDLEEPVFCAVVPGTDEFTLASGILTGNCGLHWAYGVEGDRAGMYRFEYKDGQIVAVPCENGYANPAAYACFIQSVDDDLVGPNGIMELWHNEARVFKYGGGSGSNYSEIRGANEPLSGGGVASGMMSFLKIGDRAAGSIKSGGTVRRAAKMIIVDDDHPDVVEFIDWKMKEEQKVAALVQGSKAILGLDPGEYVGLDGGVKEHKRRSEEAGVDWPFDAMNTDFQGEAYGTVSGQNGNNSVNASHAFMRAVTEDGPWNLYWRTEKRKAKAEDREPEPCKTVKAHDLWKKIATAAWHCADPGLFFGDTANEWNPVIADARIRGTNPCVEFQFLDDTGCNLASVNIVKFQKEDGTLDGAAFHDACYHWTVILDITVGMASYPKEKIAVGSGNYRPLGLGYANLGAAIMRRGLAYSDSIAREWAGAITAVMHFAAAQASVDLARELDPYPRWKPNSDNALRVIHNHAAVVIASYEYLGLTYEPERLVFDGQGGDLLAALRPTVETVMAGAIQHGMRNAQLTLIAPTGTIGLLMDCDTTGIEPDFALVKYKSMVGGGTVKIVNQSVEPALRQLGYGNREIRDLVEYVNVHGTIEGTHRLSQEHLVVFDCANPCGDGVRSISWQDHIAMMVASQPFLSGGISKTINLPASATVQDVENCYLYCWDQGLRAVSIYIDGSKLSQPLSGAKKEKPIIVEPEDITTETMSRLIEQTQGLERYSVLGGMMVKPSREKLPYRRKGYTLKLRVGDQAVYLRTGEFADGRLGEVFITLAKTGSTLRAWADCFAMAVSISLQHGVPLEALVKTFVGVRFEPSGVVQNHETVKMASSVIDLVFRELAINYLGRHDLQSIQPETESGKGEKVHGAIPGWEGGEVAVARSRGYQGEPCLTCGEFTLVRAGACMRCDTCGATSGCG